MRCWFLFLVGFLYQGVTADDPCINHQVFPTSNLGSRNERCPPPASTICDYYLPEDWYKVEEGTILSHCPNSGNCGVGYPAWMNGNLPTMADGIVHRTVCVKIDNECCKETLDIQVKQCSGFYVYYLKPFDYCPAAYCFESNRTCVEPTAAPTTPPVVPIDPCTNHKEFPSRNFGSRNEYCSTPTVPVCDYYLPEGWYSVSEGTLLSRCPSGNCGVSYPAWLNGSLPGAYDGIVERSACVKHYSDCCNETIKVRIKKCSQYYVYYLRPFDGCPMGYCFESNQPCVATTTTSSNDGGKGDKIQDSDNLLIALTVATCLVLVLVLVILGVVLWQKASRRNQTSSSREGTEIDGFKSGKAITAPEVRVPDYHHSYANANIPAISQPPTYDYIK